ncbi:MAG: serine/threonine protein kinase [Candidatus Brocadiae bacterium]|nr:serine/threonine protein kinase [Candidatus Brocadiia bacterium]
MPPPKDSDLDRSSGAGGSPEPARPHAPADIAPLVAAARRNPNLNLGKVVLLDELGRGGMGVVWRGWQEDLRRLVAVKILPGSTERDLLSRFQREARLASRLRHPNIVPVHDIGESRGRIWFTMDLVDGASLDGILRKKMFDLETLLRHVQSMAEALDYAHRNGVVHRDIKPANIMIGADGTPFLTDFGLAADVAAQTRLTVTGQVMGTPAYMSPEQARGQEGPADPRTDIYSLGAVLYEGLTGRPPVEGRSMAEVLAAILNSEIRRPSQVRRGIPQDVETICLKCLERDPGKRYATAGALARDLARVRAGESIEARPLPRVESGGQVAVDPVHLAAEPGHRLAPGDEEGDPARVEDVDEGQTLLVEHPGGLALQPGDRLVDRVPVQEREDHDAAGELGQAEGPSVEVRSLDGRGLGGVEAPREVADPGPQAPQPILGAGRGGQDEQEDEQGQGGDRADEHRRSRV